MGIDAVSFTGQNYGPSFSLCNITIVFGGSASSGQAHGVLNELAVPWHDLPENPSVFALLSWHTRTSKFEGRREELAELFRWAKASQNISMKFVTGRGGVGKSRLAAEFAVLLQRENWTAGFVDLRKQQTFGRNPDGILLIIDYPEEHRSLVKRFLQDLAGLQSAAKIRVLFLTRQEINDWRELIQDTRVESLTDMKPLQLSDLDDTSAHEVYLSTSDATGEFFDTEWKPVNQEAIADWLKEAPENGFALFVMAAAVQNALHPENAEVNYRVPDILDSLVTRELTRLRNLASSCNIADHYLFAKLLAVATIADGIPHDKVDSVIELIDSSPKLPEHFDVSDELQKIGLIFDNRIQALKPNIVAAAFVVEVLSKEPETAPEMIWFSLNEDLSGGIERLAKLTYDAEVIIGKRQFRLSHWTAEAVAGNTDRAKALEPFLSKDLPPIGLLNVAIAMCRTLLSTTLGRFEKAQILHNLSVHLSRIGDRNEAITAGFEAVEIFERLAEDNPLAFEPYLASSLNNLGTLYLELGKHHKALEAARRAVGIYERLAEDNPFAFEPHLASSLNNLGRLYLPGVQQEALEAAKRAVEIYERLAEDNPFAFEPHLASSLNNLGSLYSVSGKPQEAFEALSTAIELRESLAENSPLTFEPDLASSLNNLGSLCLELAKHQEALEAIERAIEIHKRLAKNNPLAFEPHLARNLYNLGRLYTELGKRKEALEAIERAIEIYKRLAENDPLAFALCANIVETLSPE